MAFETASYDCNHNKLPTPPPELGMQSPFQLLWSVGLGVCVMKDYCYTGLDVPHCEYCGALATSRIGLVKDHFFPRRYGGDEGSNLVTACSQCNSFKGAKIFPTREDCQLWLHWKTWSGENPEIDHRACFRFHDSRLPDDQIIHAQLIQRISSNLTRLVRNINNPSYYDPNLEWGSI